MLSAGIAPTSYSSVLTGLSLELYNQRISQGIYFGDAQISTTINSVTYTESVANRNLRVFNSKKSCYADAVAIITRFVADTTVSANVAMGILVQVNPGTGTGATTGPGTATGTIA